MTKTGLSNILVLWFWNLFLETITLPQFQSCTHGPSPGRASLWGLQLPSSSHMPSLTLDSLYLHFLSIDWPSSNLYFFFFFLWSPRSITLFFSATLNIYHSPWVSSIHSPTPHAPHLRQDRLSYSAEELSISYQQLSLPPFSILQFIVSSSPHLRGYVSSEDTCHFLVSSCTLFCQSSTLYKSYFLLWNLFPQGIKMVKFFPSGKQTTSKKTNCVYPIFTSK